MSADRKSITREKSLSLMHNYNPRANRPLEKPDKLAMEILLVRNNLEECLPNFEKAGYSMIDVTARFSDQQVEFMLQDVERKNGVVFRKDVRVRLWKMFRQLWMHVVQGPADYILEDDVPKLFLPKKDYRQIDSMLRLSELDPDRQRQIVRKTKPAPPTGRGPGIETLQFEVYRRQNDLLYEFKDVQRCVVEWERKNPRTMLQEDPREEVMKLRIRHLMDKNGEALVAVSSRESQQFYTWVGLMLLQVFLGLMAALNVFVAYQAYSNSPVELYIAFMGGSKQLISGVAFLQAFCVTYTVTQRRKTNPMIKRYKRQAINAERLLQQISEFRIETADLRLVSQEDRKQDNLPMRPLRATLNGKGNQLTAGATASLTGARLRQKNKKSKKKGGDQALTMWMNNAAFDEKAIRDKVIMQQMIEETYLHLPAPIEPIKRPGGNRMAQFESRLGGANEEELCMPLHRIQAEEKARRDSLMKALTQDIVDTPMSLGASASQFQFGPRDAAAATEQSSRGRSSKSHSSRTPPRTSRTPPRTSRTPPPAGTPPVPVRTPIGGVSPHGASPTPPGFVDTPPP